MDSQIIRRPERIEWFFLLVVLVLSTISAVVVWKSNEFTVGIRTAIMGILSASLLSALIQATFVRPLHRAIALSFQLISVLAIIRLTKALFVVVELTLSFSVVFSIALQFPVRIALIVVTTSII